MHIRNMYIVPVQTPLTPHHKEHPIKHKILSPNSSTTITAHLVLTPCSLLVVKQLKIYQMDLLRPRSAIYFFSLSKLCLTLWLRPFSYNFRLRMALSLALSPNSAYSLSLMFPMLVKTKIGSVRWYEMCDNIFSSMSVLNYVLFTVISVKFQSRLTKLDNSANTFKFGSCSFSVSLHWSHAFQFLLTETFCTNAYSAICIHPGATFVLSDDLHRHDYKTFSQIFLWLTQAEIFTQRRRSPAVLSFALVCGFAKLVMII